MLRRGESPLQGSAGGSRPLRHTRDDPAGWSQRRTMDYGAAAMEQDYRKLTDDQLELLEKQTLRIVVQALQEYSREAREIFETTEAPSATEVIVLAEDLVQYALEVAETYPINRRFAGFIDYKRVRWLPTPFGLIPQAFLTDAKALKENNRTTLQRSQLPMDADFESKGIPVRLPAGVPQHLEISATGKDLVAVTSSVVVHFYYRDAEPESGRMRDLKGIYAIAIPHQRLKGRYNPNSSVTFFGQGKHSPKREEDPRIRIYFKRLRELSPWRLQVLHFEPDREYSVPIWTDEDPAGKGIVEQPFSFLGR